VVLLGEIEKILGKERERKIKREGEEKKREKGRKEREREREGKRRKRERGRDQPTTCVRRLRARNCVGLCEKLFKFCCCCCALFFLRSLLSIGNAEEEE